MPYPDSMTPTRSVLHRLIRSTAWAILAVGLVACAETPTTAQSEAEPEPTPTVKNEKDPWEDMNRSIQSFNDEVDGYVMKPVAEGYRFIMPTVADKGITNFFSNVDDIGVFVNDFLQFKWQQGGMDLGRFMVNTVAGAGGFFDVASELDMPKHKEDFDQTLAVWGVPQGPYLVLPIFGPGSPRSVLGMAGDSATNPINFVAPGVASILSGSLNATDRRADLLSVGKIADQAAMDRYEFIRNAYMQERNYQIHDGNPPLDEDLEKEMDEQLKASSGRK